MERLQLANIPMYLLRTIHRADVGKRIHRALGLAGSIGFFFIVNLLINLQKYIDGVHGSTSYGIHSYIQPFLLIPVVSASTYAVAVYPLQ